MGYTLAHENRPRDLARLHRAERFVDVAEPAATTDHLVQHQAALAIELQVAGNVGTEAVAAHAEAPAELVLARYESGYGISETRLPPAVDQPFAFHRNLADHLHLGEPLAITPASVRRVISVLEAAQRSSTRGGAPVVIEDDES